MKNVFLSSSFADTEHAFLSIFGKKLRNKVVAFIPTASLNEEVNFYVDTGRELLEKLGMIVKEIEVSTASFTEISDILQNSDIIYITGGNTAFLLQELRKSGADNIIQEQISLGKLYIGESAGSIVVSPNIEYIKDMDDFSIATTLSDFTGLNVVDFYPLPHYGEFPFAESAEIIMKKYGSSLDLKPINNSQAIHIHGNNISIVN